LELVLLSLGDGSMASGALVAGAQSSLFGAGVVDGEPIDLATVSSFL